MIFTKIRLGGITNVDLPLIGALPSDTFLLKAADGLGPPDIDVSIVPTLYPGGVYLGRRPGLREIVLRVGLNPNWNAGQTPEQLRTTLYGLLSTQTGTIVVSLMDGTTVVGKTTGSVKRIEIVPFSKDPEVQITIPCTHPYLAGPSVIVQVPAPANKLTVPIVNEGTAPTGFYTEIAMTAARTFWSFSLTPNATTPPFLRVDYAFAIGDILKIDTRWGMRSIKVVRSGATTDLLGSMSATSSWLEMFGGTNTLYMIANTYTWNSFNYTPQFWGV